MKTREILQSLRTYAEMFKDDVNKYTSEKVRSYVEGMNKGMDYIINSIDDYIRLGIIEDESEK